MSVVFGERANLHIPSSQTARGQQVFEEAFLQPRGHSELDPLPLGVPYRTDL